MNLVPAQELTRQARRLLGLNLVPLLLLVLLLAGLQARRAWTDGLEQAGTELALQRQVFDSLARDVDRHVRELARAYLQAGTEQQLTPELLQALRPRERGGITLDALPEPMRSRTAQLLLDPGHAAPERLAQARAVGWLAEAAHQRQAELAWSYVFTWPERGLMVYPWVPTPTVFEGLGREAISAGLRGWYDYQVNQNGLFEAAIPYWTRPYLDAISGGAVVSHGAPVRQGGQLLGIAGTDLRLSALTEPLARLPAGPWRAWLLDSRGPLMADRQNPLPADRLVQASERLPAAVLEAMAKPAAADGKPQAVPGWRFIAQPVSGSPWLLVLAAPTDGLAATLLPPLWPFALLLVALLVLWMWAHLKLGRLVLPMLELFEHLLALARQPSLPAPLLGARWQPWVERLRTQMAEGQQAQRAQQAAEALKSAVIDHAQIALIVIDAEDRVHEYNPAAEALLGHRRADLLGQPLHPVICPERFRAMNLAAIEQMRSGDPEHLAGRVLQRRVLNAAGEEIPVELVMWTLSTPMGGALVTLSLRDLRAQRAAEALIERQRDALRQSEKLTAMGSLLASVAHELNNPLTIVSGRAALLEEHCAGLPQAQDATRVREAAERCARIVKTFLTMARSRDARRLPLQLNTLAQAAAELLAYTLRSHGVELALQLDGDAPNILGDPDQLGQIVLNLLINAQQALASRDAPRRITLSCGHDASHAWLQVADNGPGVPPGLREQIFDPFFSTKGEGSGTGLGLSVSRGIAREHGGELSLLDAGPGACFELRLPLAP